MPAVQMLIETAEQAEQFMRAFGHGVAAIPIPPPAEQAFARSRRFGLAWDPEGTKDPEAYELDERMRLLRRATAEMRQDGPADAVQQRAGQLGRRAGSVAKAAEGALTTLKSNTAMAGAALTTHIELLRAQLAAAQEAKSEFEVSAGEAVRQGQLAVGMLKATQDRAMDLAEVDFES